MAIKSFVLYTDILSVPQMHKENMFNTYAQVYSAVRKYIILELFDFDPESANKYALISFLEEYVSLAGAKIVSCLDDLCFEVFFENWYNENLDASINSAGFKDFIKNQTGGDKVLKLMSASLDELFADIIEVLPLLCPELENLLNVSKSLYSFFISLKVIQHNIRLKRINWKIYKDKSFKELIEMDATVIDTL